MTYMTIIFYINAVPLTILKKILKTDKHKILLIDPKIYVDT